jgi:type II restriction/modification system DNA methylase subunit YeeA
MILKTIINSKFSEDDFLKFIENKLNMTVNDNLDFTPIDDELSYKKVVIDNELKDKSQIEVIILKSDTDITKARVKHNKILQKIVKNNDLDLALMALYNQNDLSIWKLSLVVFDNNKQLTNARKFTFELGNVPTKTALTQLSDLGARSTKNDYLEAFSVEKISKEFFDEYKKLYFDICDSLESQKPIFRSDKDLKLFVKKLLGRVVFLYFLEKKGWLGAKDSWGDGDKKFLSNQFKNFKDDNFYFDILQPIFFEALNTKRKDDYFKKLDCKMPFLNGGLFSKDEFDKRDIIIENDIFQNIFKIFDSYNFTVIEDNPDDSEVAIDPEMLGRVFEDLLEDRKDKGAFYTPREIVHYMCQQSIINYLLNSFDDEDAINDLVLKQITDNQFIRKNAKQIQTKLFNIKVLDPSIGSGAFPMGMLHEIVQVLSNIDKTANIGQLKRKAIENSIYGVDIEQSAVEIAKLRFWLSIVVDEDDPTPLPNLFYKIMVGNSLIETINGFDPLKKDLDSLFSTDDTLIDKIKILLHKFYNASLNKEKESYQKEIEDKIDIILNEKLAKYKEEIQSQLQNISILDVDKKQTKLIERLHDSISIIEKVKQRPTTKLFFYKLYFSEVINGGGFDVVIGNPPYVRQEKIKELKALKEIQNFKSYCGTADLYIYFFEKGFNLLKENGVLSYITSNKYTRAKYGKDFRKFVLENTTIKEYVDFNGVKVFESATVDTSIMTYQKNNIKNSNFKYCKVDEKYKKNTLLNEFIVKKGYQYSQDDLTQDSFSFANLAELKIKKQIEKIGTPLKYWDVKIYRGLLTGFNEAFIIDGKTKDELIAKDSKSAEIIKPILRGRDIKKYSYEFADKWLINSHNNPPVNIENYPAIKEHLDQYYDKLAKRSDKGETPYNLRNCAYLDEFEKEKIIYPETVQGAYFYLDTKSYYIDKTAFILIGKNIKYIFSIISTKVLTHYYKNYCSGVILGEKGYQYNKHAVEKLPIPQISKKEQKPFEILVDYILFCK